MTDSGEQRQSSDSPLIAFWKRIPIVIRAIVVGLLVFASAGAVARTLVLVLVPAPASIAVMGGVLWIYWKYFSGSWWPRSTAEARSSRFRATRLSGGVWKWSLTAAMLAVVAMESGLVITFRILEFPADTWTVGIDLGTTPPWLAWSLVIMASIVAGVTEEVGFRGYTQVPLERRYGPVLAIAIVSVVFVVFHLNQAWAPPVLALLLVMSVMWGILALASGSLLPGMISHANADVLSFSY